MRISDWSSDVCSSDLTVIMQENCAREGDTLRLTAEPPAPGRDIRVRGGDFSEHALLVARGARMTPAAIALAIMGGHGMVPVHRRTRIALISTGDELAAPGAMTGPHQIPPSNGPMLAAMLRSTGCDVDGTGGGVGDLRSPAGGCAWGGGEAREGIGLSVLGGTGPCPVHLCTGMALLSTGDWLATAGAMTGPHQMPASNGPMLAAMLRSTGCDVDDMGVVGNDLDSIKGAVDAARRHDIILTIGGASVGDHDLVKPAFLACGATLDFIKVALKPGKPLMAGRLGNALVLGLPGNPVSAYVTCFLFALPLVRKLMGAATPLPPVLPLPLGARSEEHTSELQS